MKLNQKQLIKMIRLSRGAPILGVTYSSDARLKKTGNPYGEVYKETSCVVQLAVNYKRALEKQAAIRGENPVLETHARTWGKVMEDCRSLVEYNGKHYLNAVLQNKIYSKYFTKDGKELTLDEVKPFLPKSSHSVVPVINPALSHIKEIRFKGRKYEVV